MSATPQLCPLCREPNRCALAAREQDNIDDVRCWCMEQVFPKAKPSQRDGQACVCRACVQRLAND